MATTSEATTTPDTGSATPEPDAPPSPAGRTSGSGGGTRRGKRGGRKQDRKPSSSRPGRNRSLKRPLEDLFVTLGTVTMAVQPFDGACITAGAPELAKALDELAKQDPAVYRALERMVSGSAWGGVFAALGAVAVPIVANHMPQLDAMGLKAAGVGTRAERALDERAEKMGAAFAAAMEKAAEQAAQQKGDGQ